jgi:FtsZ-binding cell division protein ZapB
MYTTDRTYITGFLITLFIIGIIWGIVLIVIAKRKGKRHLLWFFAGLIPLGNLISSFYILSLPDVALREQIDTLKDEVNNLKQQINTLIKECKQVKPEQQLQLKWECTCGTVNDMNITNCPKCGLKRDYLLKKYKELKPDSAEGNKERLIAIWEDIQGRQTH